MRPEDHPDSIYKFAFIPGRIYRYLAEKSAEKEIWQFPTNRPQSYTILKSYLDYTFRVLKQQKKIYQSQNRKYAVFNTGLITSNLQPFYAFLEQNRNEDRQPWSFKSVVTDQHGQLTNNFEPPYSFAAADFFEDPSRLVYNPNYSLVVNVDHIINDRRYRFPENLKKEANIRATLRGAVEELKIKLRTHYRLALPQYYYARQEVNLFLPLDITSSPGPDLALVVSRDGKAYKARTCLSLRQAYQNARLLGKVDDTWLGAAIEPRRAS